MMSNSRRTTTPTAAPLIALAFAWFVAAAGVADPAVDPPVANGSQVCAKRWEQSRKALVVQPVSQMLTSDMPTIAFVPRPIPASAWLELARFGSRGSDDEAALTAAYIEHLDAFDAIHSKRLRPLASEVEAVYQPFRSNDAAAIATLCGTLIPRAIAIDDELHRIVDRCLAALASRTPEVEGRRTIDCMRLQLALLGNAQPMSFFQALPRINCDDIVRSRIEWLPPESHEAIEQRLDAYRTLAVTLLRAREVCHFKSMCNAREIEASASMTDDERFDALKQARSSLMRVEQQMHANNLETMREIARLAGEPEGQMFLALFEAQCYPHLFPDATDLREFVREIIMRTGPDAPVSLLSAAAEQERRRIEIADTMMRLYDGIASDFTLTRGAGDAYRRYLEDLAVLAARRLANARDLLRTTQQTFADHPSSELVRERCDQERVALEAALRMTAFPGQGLVIELVPERGVARLTGISQVIEVPIPK